MRNPPDEPDRIRRIRYDPDALEAFYREHVAAVQRSIARRVDDPHLVADLTSEVFLAVLDAAGGYDPDRGPVGAWLHGVTRNVVSAELRRRARESAVLRRAGGRRELDPASLARIEERIDAERSAREIHRALAELPERDRRLLELVAVDGLSVVDAARVLGVKPATARVRLHRSRARLDTRLRRRELPGGPTLEVIR